MRPLPALAAVLAAALLVLGAAWGVANLGDVPHYGDTVEYVHLAQTLEVDDYRGVLYPAFLAGLDRLLGEPSILRPFVAWHEEGPCDLSPRFAGVQLVQAALFLPALAYFVLVFAGWAPRGGLGSGRRRRVAVLVLVALLALDPLVAHFQLSVMTDGLALAGSMVFCAALTDLRWRRTSRPLAVALLLVSFLVTAGLRAEKRWVLLATVLGVLLAWWLLRRRSGAVPRLSRGALLALLLATAGGFAAVTAVQRAVHRESGRWPLVTSMLQQRVIFPNVVATYGSLPEWIRRRIPPPAAEHFDRHHQNGRQIVDQVTRGDVAERERMVREMAAVAWRGRWPHIVGDVLRDAAENVLATPSFYVRLATHAAVDEQRFREIFYSDGTRWTYTRLEQHHPRLSRPYLAVAAALLLAGVALALARWRTLRRAGRGRPSAETLAYHAPVAVFVLLNAVLFAVASDLVHVRYALLAHVALLLAVGSAALAVAPPAPLGGGGGEEGGGAGQCT